MYAPIVKAAQLAAALVLLAGCSSDTDPFSLPNGPAGGPSGGATLAITPTNAETASAAAYLAAVEIASFGGIAASVEGAVGEGVISKPAGPAIGKNRLAELVRSAPFGPNVLNCIASGTVSISGDIAAPNQLTVGDTVILVFEACDDGIGVTIDGRVETAVNEFSFDEATPDQFRLGLAIVFNNLRAITTAETLATNGDAGVILDLTSATTEVTSVGGNSLTLEDGSRSDTVSNYSLVQTVTQGAETLTFVVDTSGTVNSSLLTGTFVFATPVAFSGTIGEFPSAGEVLITGASSSVRFVVLDSTNVRLDVDSDGNGEVDVSIDTTWVALLAS